MHYELPYDFVLKELYPVRPKARKMLGCYALMIDKKILMLLRDREQQPEFNGVFVATSPEHYEALQSELHRSRMEFDLDGAEHTWIFISEDLDDFEAKVKKACEMIKSGDERIGKYAT
jgi:hypothetical protein